MLKLTIPPKVEQVLELSLVTLPLILTSGCNQQSSENSSFPELTNKPTVLWISSTPDLVSAYKREESTADQARWGSYIEPNSLRRELFYNRLVSNFSTASSNRIIDANEFPFSFSSELTDEMSVSFIKTCQGQLEKLESLVEGVASVVDGKSYQGAESLFQVADWATQDALSNSNYIGLLEKTLNTTNCVAKSLTFAASAIVIMNMTETNNAFKIYYVVGGAKSNEYPDGIGHATLVFGNNEFFVDPSTLKDGKFNTRIAEIAPNYFYPLVAAPFTVGFTNGVISISRDTPQTWSVPSSFRSQ